MTTTPPNLTQNFVEVWQMPFATQRRPVLQHSDTLLKASWEASLAMKRFKGGTAWVGISKRDSAESASSETLKSAINDLRAYASGQGRDFDSLVESASKHFTSTKIVRRNEPLTPAELELFSDYEQSAPDRSMP
jgi:hypothetical protein